MRKCLTILVFLFSVSSFGQVKPFIPKQDQKLPDNYSVKIVYITGKEEIFELASHRLNSGLFEFETKDDLWNWVPISNVIRIEFDNRFSKIMPIKERELNDRNKQNITVGSQPSK